MQFVLKPLNSAAPATPEMRIRERPGISHPPPPSATPKQDAARVCSSVLHSGGQVLQPGAERGTTGSAWLSKYADPYWWGRGGGAAWGHRLFLLPRAAFLLLRIISYRRSRPGCRPTPSTALQPCTWVSVAAASSRTASLFSTSEALSAPG